MKSATRRIVLPIAALAILGLALSACSSGASTAGQTGTADGVVKIEGPLIGNDAKLLEQSWAGWEKTNHIKIEYSGSSNFQEQIGGEAQQGNPPDLAIFEQPGLIDDLAKLGYIQKLPANVKSMVDSTFPSEWVNYTTVGSADYAAPLLAKLNGWVFYSPTAFDKLNLKVPTNWSQLLTLTEYLRANSGQAPWCEGFASDASSGAAGESWINDLVLREDGPTVYDEWAAHKILFTDPAIEKAFNDAAEILQNRDWVNAGFGGVASINTTTTAQVATALESGKCLMTMQSSSFLDDLQTTSKGVETVGPQQNIWAFILPPINSGSTPFTVSGDFVAAFSNDADTIKVQNYLASDAWATSRVKLGGAISPATAITPSTSPEELLNASDALLESSNATIRLSASDLMPSVVGEGTFLSGMVDWINGTPMTKVLTTIDGSWPKS
ncbi:MAG TPA: extracellular solute-binding protein [Galbitalea sp.]|jgi:alpha-glucoside transport system substrate-binding protein|nr:extracellular solute-binding protein [Galbitalea sp.]